MDLKYAGNCTTCGTRVEKGVEAWYDPTTKVTCTSCRPTGAQLGLDAEAPSERPVASPPPTATARTDREKGTQLEGDIARVFAAHGYRVETNVVREGRSGARHEIDVLAEKSDDLLTLTVAIECKAWNNPIDKAVVSKFADVCHDLGIGHSLVVSLNGSQPGALSMAEQRGVAIWGQDEIARHIGKSSILDLQNRPVVQEVGFPRSLPERDAMELIERDTSGTLGIGKHEVRERGTVWLPVAVVPLTLMTAVSIRRSSATTQMWAVYDLIGGTFLTGLESEPERISVELDGPRLPMSMKVAEPAKRLDDIVRRYKKASRDETIGKYRAQMDVLGVPINKVPTTGTSTPFLYPVYLAIAEKRGAQRVVAVDAYRGRIDADLGHELSKQISMVREVLAGS